MKPHEKDRKRFLRRRRSRLKRAWGAADRAMDELTAFMASLRQHAHSVTTPMTFFDAGPP